MDGGEFRQVASEYVPDDPQHYVSIYTLTVDAESDFSAELLADPLPILTRSLVEVDEGWTVSVERVNAEIMLKGPRKLIWIFTVLPTLQRVQAVALRVPEAKLR
jgi:hypothetical protein